MVLHAWILTAVSLLEITYLKVQQLIMAQQILAGISSCQCELPSILQGNFRPRNLTYKLMIAKTKKFQIMCCDNEKHRSVKSLGKCSLSCLKFSQTGMNISIIYKNIK